MSNTNPRSSQLLLRAQRTNERGEILNIDLFLPQGSLLRLGREPRPQSVGGELDIDYGSDLVVPGDKLISNFHATVIWQSGVLRVRRAPRARNPIYRIDPDNPDMIRPGDDFELRLSERFRIGNTIFTALPDMREAERTISGEELDSQEYVDPAPRIEALGRLPALIRGTPDEERLLTELLEVLLGGIPRAELAAAVALQDDAVVVLSTRTRDGKPRNFQPSRRLVERALQGYENVRHIWQAFNGADLESGDSSGRPYDRPTRMVGTDWALCVPLRGSSREGLYVAGQLAGSADSSIQTLLDADLKFANLAGEIFVSLRQLRSLQRREGFLAQLLTPVVRHALAGQSFEELTTPKQIPVSVLFCDLRGSVKTVSDGGSNLLDTWGKVSQALDVMTEGIVSTDGVVGDFQGDAAMGFWGWPLPQEDQTERAARAALFIRKKFFTYSGRYGHPLSGFVCGLGIAQGEGVAGRLGSTDQMKIGVFGPSVNLAARLESATKSFGVPILIDAASIEALSKSYSLKWCRIRQLGPVRFQGVPEPIRIAELLPPEVDPGPNMREENRLLFEAALERFTQGDWLGFRNMTQNINNDGPVQFFLKYIERHSTPNLEPPSEWDGSVAVFK